MSDQDPFSIVDRLIKRGVQLVIVGGHAVTFHGYVRATQDVDIVFDRCPESEAALLEEFSKLGAYRIGSEIDPATGFEKTHLLTLGYIQQTHLMMIGTDVGWFDLFDFIPGMPSESVHELIGSADVSSGRPFASLKWLKRMKSVAGRPQDLIDLENLP